MDYFRQINCHLQGEMDVDAATDLNSQTKIISLGCDDLIRWRNLSNNEADQKQLPPDQGVNKIALHPSGQRFLIGGQCKRVQQYSVITKEKLKTMYESLGTVLDIKYSGSGRYVSIATEEQKVTILDTQNNRSTKCRPGHSNRVLNTFFSSHDRYVASIGEDNFVLIYQISPERDPKQVYRTAFANEQIPFGVQGCFFQMRQGYKVFVPGTVQLQIVEQLSNRWEIKKTNIAHSSQILVVQVITQHLLVTSCNRDMCIWNLQAQQKLVVLQDFPFTKIIPIPNSFIGNRNDGSIYFYNRPLPKIEAEPQQQAIEAEQNGSRIEFDNEDNGQQNIQLEYANQQQQEEEHPTHKESRKRIADRLIKTVPQQPLTRETTFFYDNRFVYTNLHGCVVESIQLEQKTILVEFYRQNEEPLVKNLFKNKPVQYVDMDSKTVCYANQTQFGVKIDKFSSWEKDWFDIQGIAFGGNWLAVANTSEIKFLDISGNQIKSVCFDRPIIAMQAYENLLAVVYHQSVPMYQNQMLAMKIFTVKQFQILNIAECQVPLTTLKQGQKKGSTLRWFGFSNEGMIFSQDSRGEIRAYSLQTNEWTLLYTDAANDPKKIWIIGFSNYQVVYWKTTDEQPEPTVRPRLNIKTAKLAASILSQYSQQTKQLPYLMWRRYCLDHELARWRLWNRNKQTRNQKHVNYHKSKNIMSEKQIFDQNQNLDVQFYPIIKFYIKDKHPQKASNLTKAYIRSIQAGRNLIELFDDSGYRNLAIDLQFFYDEKEKDIQYEAIQQLNLKQLRSKIQVCVRPKRDNPMNPKFKKPLKEVIPYNLSSQSSQNSSIMEDITHRAPQNSKAEQIIENPFLKKKSTGDSRKQEIEQQIQKYGVKKKVEEKKKNKG